MRWFVSRSFARRAGLIPRGFRVDERGAAAIEFAMLFIPFFCLLFGILELGVVLLLGTAIENTTQQIARLVKTGQLQQYNIQSMSDFRSKLLCPPSGPALLPPYLSCSRLTVDIRTTGMLSNANLSDDIYKSTSVVKYCLGAPQSIVVVRLAYAFPAILPMLAVLANGTLGRNLVGLVNDVPNYAGWNHMIFRAVAFENESYSSSSSACY